MMLAREREKAEKRAALGDAAMDDDNADAEEYNTAVREKQKIWLNLMLNLVVVFAHVQA